MTDESATPGGPAASATGAQNLPPAVDRATFQAELDGLRAREKAHTREGDAIAAARRRLPMVEVDASLTLTGPDGEQLQIIRANMPFGQVGTGEFGTYYIAYAATPSITEQMLENMFLGSPPGNTDRILDFSTALTGCNFFAPAADWLDDPPGPPAAQTAEAAQDEAQTAEAPTTATGSLGIGSLKGQR